VGKIRRGGYVFVTWIGDHGRHVHVFRDGRGVLKWDLEKGKAVRGRCTRRLRRLLAELLDEGALV
jgi:hypothetical protein